jgi:hypothetical protein
MEADAREYTLLIALGQHPPSSLVPSRATGVCRQVIPVTTAVLGKHFANRCPVVVTGHCCNMIITTAARGRSIVRSESRPHPPEVTKHCGSA